MFSSIIILGDHHTLGGKEVYLPIILHLPAALLQLAVDFTAGFLFGSHGVERKVVRNTSFFDRWVAQSERQDPAFKYETPILPQWGVNTTSTTPDEEWANYGEGS